MQARKGLDPIFSPWHRIDPPGLGVRRIAAKAPFAPISITGGVLAAECRHSSSLSWSDNSYWRVPSITSGVQSGLSSMNRQRIRAGALILSEPSNGRLRAASVSRARTSEMNGQA